MKIAVFIGGIAYEIQKRLLEGIMKYAREEKISIHVFTANGDLYKQSEYGMGEFQIYQLPDLSRYDGIIFARDTIQNERYADDITGRIRRSGKPVVSIENPIDGMPVFYVDNREAMEEITTHLITMHGAKDFYYLSGPRENPESAERLKGVRDALKKYGMELDDKRIYYGNYWIDSGKRFAKELIRQGEYLHSAVICANDDMALGVYTELLKCGVQIGSDILLTGFDHATEAAYLIPAITTVEKPQIKIGYEACRSLAEEKVIRNQKFKVKCCLRGSCGCREHRRRNVAEIQLWNTEQKLEAVSMAENNKNMASDLNDCDNIQDFCECLKSYIAQLDFSFVYLCLCEEEVSEDKAEYDYHIRENYTERVFIPIAYEKGKFTTYSYFNSNEFLPGECREKTEGEVCIATPLHFRRNCLGYLVMCGSEMPFNNVQFQNWIMNISSALENIRKQEELRRLVRKLNRVWMLDNLTQVYNRAGFFHYAERILDECRKKNAPIGVIFADINKLKSVNDNYGHEEGDFYIRAVADNLKSLVGREQILMRYGGDEFVVLGKCEKEKEFLVLLEGINPKLEKCRQENKKNYEMSVSIGFQSVSVTKEFKLDQLIEKADREMYKMKKEKGRGVI